MSETPTDPADVHTGTDRVELTDDLSRLREVVVEVAANALRQEGTHYNSILHADKVARLAIEAALPSLIKRVETAEAQLRTEGWLDAHGACMEIERRLAADRDAARAELAAANTRASQLAIERHGFEQAARDNLRICREAEAERDALAARYAELEEDFEDEYNRAVAFMVERDDWEREANRAAARLSELVQEKVQAQVANLRAALTPEGTP